MDPDIKGERRGSESEGSQGGCSAEKFFARLNGDVPRAKPGDESVAAAIETIQRMALESDSEETYVPQSGSLNKSTCQVCGSTNRGGNRFCASCGVPLLAANPEQQIVPEAASQPQPPAGQHHYHHHYHHHYFGSAERPAFSDSRPSSAGVPDPRVRVPLSSASLSRAEAAVRKVVQDFAVACNAKRLDDLLELYTPDALLFRSNVPPVRGAAAIREFFCGVLDAGLADVDLQAIRVDVFGDTAYEAGRCKMLVPVGTGKRREERGKYLLFLNRQAGDWKIVADCWSSDLSLGAESFTPSATASLLPRPPRKS